jgi:hypothetical protein
MAFMVVQNEREGEEGEREQEEKRRDPSHFWLVPLSAFSASLISQQKQDGPYAVMNENAIT